MSRQVVVVGHADADGHVIAEQVRRNLEAVTSFRVSTVVDPKLTAGHKAWLHLDAIREIEEADLVFFVDLMFATSSFDAEAGALVRFARERPEKRFFVLDHHPLPLRRLSEAANLRALYFEDVMDCTIGTPSAMMIVAALSETQATRARTVKKPIDGYIVKGLKRAAAPGGTLSGARLLALLRFNRWRDLEMLGREGSIDHPMPRGRRPEGTRASDVWREMEKTADALLITTTSSRSPTQANAMSYDFETVTERKANPVATDYAPLARDLEAIVTLLQVAAIELTPVPGAQFTQEQLLEKARELGGDEFAIDEKDVKIILGKPGFLKKVAGGKFQLK